jgi:hypothetical protein
MSNDVGPVIARRGVKDVAVVSGDRSAEGILRKFFVLEGLAANERKGPMMGLFTKTAP